MVDFDKQSYWRDRFIHETTFEWLIPSKDLLDVLTTPLNSEPHAHPQGNNSIIIRPNQSTFSSSRVLQLGSGTSDLHVHLRQREFQHITNVDYEPLALDRGRSIEEQVFGDVEMMYAVVDVVQLDSMQTSELGGPFDLVIDKSTADAVSCAGDEALRRMVEGVERHLAPGGVWISLSYSAERFSSCCGGGSPLEVEVVHRFPTPKSNPNEPDIYHWCYRLRRRGGSDPTQRLSSGSPR